MLHELDLTYLDGLLNTDANDLSAKLLSSLSDESFTVAMYRAGFLTAVTNEDDEITGWDFQPPQNFDMFMTGTSGADVLSGGNGDDIINGGNGADTLYGGEGNDILYGGAGRDTLYGGEGADTFTFFAADVSTGVDTIADFDTAEGDMIDISDILTAYDPLTDAIEDFVKITDDGIDSYVAIDVDGGANGYQITIIVEGTTGLTNEQLLVDSGTLVV